MQAPDHITITDATGNPVAFLSPAVDGLADCEIEAQLNGQCTVTFKLPLTSDKASEIQPERRILAGGREFALLAPASEERSRDGRKLWHKVTAPESWTLLGKVFVTVGNDSEPTPSWGTVSILASDLGRGGFDPGSAGSALYRLLQGTGWAVGTCDAAGSHDLETERISLLANIQKVQELWGGYLVWDSVAKTVSLRDETAWQPGSGVRIQYAKNLKGVTREVNSDLTTRLYPFGQDGLNIASVNGGQLYIEDHSYSSAVYEGIWENQDLDDPAELLAAAQKALADLAKPRISYQVSMVDLSALPEYAHESFALGDIVRIIDPELSIDATARIVKHRYPVFQPWQATLEIGKPTETLPSMLAGAVRTTAFVQKILRPNPGNANLLKGIVNTFSTTINSASGKLIWSDDTLQAIEVDGSGSETGRRVRITPGGVGISTDGGQTYATAMTGQGVLANAVIVSDLYALASDDGYTRLSGDGLHVFDPASTERVHVGRWLANAVEHYGIRIFSASGTTLLDDQGILQTWQEGAPWNVDSGHPATLNVYLPPETISIKQALLRFRRLPYRAYSTGAASGGGQTSGPSSVSTTASGGGQTSGPSSALTTASGGGQTSGPSSTSTTQAGGEVINTQIGFEIVDGSTLSQLSNVVTDQNTAAHNHGIPDGTVLQKGDGTTVTFVAFGGDSHSHDTMRHAHRFSLDPHSHGMDHTHQIADHTHGMDHTHQISNHTHGMDHTHQIAAHTHPITYGIYEGPAPTQITIKINGIDRTSALGGPFTTDQSGLDISPYLNAGLWNTIEIGASSLGLIDPRIFVQAHMGV